MFAQEGARKQRIEGPQRPESQGDAPLFSPAAVCANNDDGNRERSMDTLIPQTSSEISEWVSAAALRLEEKVIAWRRDIHANPELGYHETRTAALAAKHLKALGYEVQTGVGDTGVVGILKGGKPGGCVALRADMDALPVEERVDLPFASKVKAPWQGGMTGVMHACGHDAHVAILMGVAEVWPRTKPNSPAP